MGPRIRGDDNGLKCHELRSRSCAELRSSFSPLWRYGYGPGISHRSETGSTTRKRIRIQVCCCNEDLTVSGGSLYHVYFDPSQVSGAIQTLDPATGNVLTSQPQNDTR